MGGSYFFWGSNLEIYGKFWKNSPFSGRIWPDWRNTTRADLAGLGSIGLRRSFSIISSPTIQRKLYNAPHKLHIKT